MAEERSIAEKIVTTFLLIIITLIGTFGNFLISYIFNRKGMVNHVHISTRYLIINLGIVDMIISISNVVYLLNLHGYNLTGNYILCQTSGFVNIGLVLSSIWIIVLIGLNRACIVTRKPYYFTKNRTLFYIFLAWLLPMLIGIAPIFGWSKYFNRKSQLVCTIVFLNSRSFSVFYLIAFELVPGVTLGVCTFIILKIKKKNLKRIVTFEISNKEERLKQDSRQTVMLLVVILAFVICFLPECLLKRVRRHYVPHTAIDALSSIFRLTNHAANPLIYGLLNTDFRRSLFRIISKIVRCK